MKTGKTKHIKFKKLQLLLIVLFALLISDLYSQVSIKGNVKNENDDPIEFASVQLLFDSKYHQSTLSDSLGNYSLEATLKGDCELLINILGYSTARKELTLRNDTEINFVLQTDSICLKEVTIIGQKDLIQAKSDGYVINIEGNIKTEGKETTDLLRQLPTINVSEESINIFGKTSVLVYINDRIVRLEGQSLLSYLNSLPPDIINSVEIMSTPPAQYDAEGNVGIVKIVTKKNIQPGWKEYFKVGGMKNSYTSYMLSAYVNYTGEKLFFDGNITNGSYTYLNQSEYYNYFPYQTTAAFNPKKWNYSSAEVQTSLGYHFNDNSTIVVDFQAPLYNKETIGDIENHTRFINSTTNHQDSIIYSDGSTLKNKQTYNAEVFFKHSFADKKSFFTASTAYLNNNTSNARSFTSLTQVEDTDLTTEDYDTEGNQNYNILTSKLDFSFPLLSCTVKTGLKLSFINTSSDSKFFTVLDGNINLEPSLSNQYSYTENVQSVYYSMEKNIPNWSFKGGLRSEITKTSDNSVLTDESHKDNYINIFPSLYISHRFNNGSRIALSYANRLERPPYQYMDPFRWYISKYDYAVGNPYLKPSDIRNIELSFVPSNTFSTKIYYTGQTNKIGQYVVLDSLNIMNQIQLADNFLNENSFGINVYKLLKLNTWLETVLQGDFYYSEYLSNRKEFSNIYGMGSTFIMNNTFFLHKNFQMVLNLEERIPGLYNYRSMENFFRVDVGINYISNKKNFEVRLFAGDVFKTANPEYYYFSGGVKQVYKNDLDSRILKLVVSWRPGNWYNKSMQIPSPSNIDEKQRL
ncbi:MAG: TonB-dependent receptor [Bacteroidales bacterium]|nr:TonB-dependent receptor [Bacteroidales bacterium]